MKWVVRMIRKVKKIEKNSYFQRMLYLVTAILASFSIMEVFFSILPKIIEYSTYIFAGITVALTSYFLINDSIKEIKKKILPIIENYSFVDKLYKDYKYRALWSALISFTINIFFSISNGILAIMNDSLWLGTLSIYYIFLSVMRSGVITFAKNISKDESDNFINALQKIAKTDQDSKRYELKIYRKCGILLIMVTILLSVAVALVSHQQIGRRYPDVLIYAVAAYTFYKVILSITNMIKARKLNSPLLVTVRNIGYVDAMVSLLTLQASMLVAFDSNTETNAQMMNVFTGGFVCFLILVLGLHMVYSAEKQLKMIREQKYIEYSKQM